MTKQEFSVLAMAIKAVYPNMLPDNGAMDVWYRMLQDLDYESASIALQTHMMTSRFPPTIADIRGGCTKREELSEMEAWALTLKAIRNGLYGAEEEFAKLPEIVQKTVGSPAVLREWAGTNCGSGSVTESNFLRAYRTQAERAKHEAQISPAVKDLLDAPKMKLLKEKA